MSKRDKKKKRKPQAKPQKQTPERPPDLADQVGVVADFLVLVFLCFYLVARPLVPSMGASGEAALVGGASGLGTDALLQAFVVTAFLLWFLRSVLEGGLEVAFSGLELPALLFLGLAGVSAVAAADSFHAWVRLGHWLTDLCCFWLVLQYGRTTLGARLLMRVLLATAIVVSLNGLWQYLWGFEQMREQGIKMLDQIPANVRDHFLIRLESRRVFSTFVLANGLAGYLLLLLPLAMVLPLGEQPRRWRAAGLLTLLLFGVTLLLSGSKGGVLALAGALGFGLLACGRAALRHRKAAGVVFVLLGLGVGLFCLTAYRAGPFAGVRDRLGDTFPTRKVLAKTARVRLEYWDAAWRIATDHPLRGVGPDNFVNYYHAYRAPRAGETQRAHNNYLQVAAELGFPGLLALLALGGALLLRLLRRGPEPLDEPPTTRANIGWGLHQSGWIYVTVGIVAFIFLYLLDESFDGPIGPDGTTNEAAAYLLAAVVWLACGPLLRPRVGRLTVWAMAVGVAGFALHSLVDFDLYVMGITSTLAAVAGLLCAQLSVEWGRPVRRWAVPLWLRVGLVVVLLPPFYIYSNVWLVGTYRAERYVESAGGLLKQRSTGLAMNDLDRAIEQVPWDYGPHFELGQLYVRGFMRSKDYKQVVAGRQALARGQHHLGKARELNRRHAGSRFLAAQGSEHFAKVFLRDRARFPVGSKMRGDLEREARKAQEDALRFYREAVALYPTKPMYRYFLGRLLLARGERAAGRAEYRKALEYHLLRDKTDSIRLPEEAVYTIRQALR